MTEESRSNNGNTPPRTPVRWFTELSGIGLGVAAVLYVCGYLAHTVYYRLLGVDVGAQPLTYLTFAGDYLISIVISILQLFSLFGDYWGELRQNCLWLAIVFCLLSLLSMWFAKRKPHRARSLGFLVCVLIGLAGIVIGVAELRVLRVQNVLQPFSPIETQGDGQENSEKQKRPLIDRITIVKESYQEHENLPVVNEWKRWFNPLTSNTQQQRTHSYLALLLLNVVFVLTLVITIQWSRGGFYSKFLLGECLVGLLVVLLLAPCIYATLGRVFLFPVVRVELRVDKHQNTVDQDRVRVEGSKEVPATKEPETILTHPVFLIFQDDEELILYDRLDLFQLKRIPRSRVIGITQLYNSSPFEDCHGGSDFAPCETLWIKDNASILDF